MSAITYLRTHKELIALNIVICVFCMTTAAIVFPMCQLPPERAMCVDPTPVDASVEDYCAPVDDGGDE